VGNRVIYIYNPTIDQIYEAEELYNDVLNDARFLGVLSEPELLEWMNKYGYWTDKQEDQLSLIPNIITRLKIELWNAYENYHSKRMKQIRNQLAKNRAIFNRLIIVRHRYDMYTDTGVAAMSKMDYMVLNTSKCGQRSLDDQDDAWMLPFLVDQYVKQQPTEHDLRRLARSEAWRALWSVGKSESGVIGAPSACLNEPQKALIGWSKLYDSVHESMDCPPEEVFDDDDLLDGWLIVENKKQDDERKQKAGRKFDKKLDKPGMQEVFVPVDSPEDAKRIDEMNDAQARVVKRQRMELIAKHGVVPEEKMPDSQQVMRQQALQEFRQRVKKK
jgi:hypothetical protein